MNIQTALSFPFKDPKWVVKLLIGGALSLVTLMPMALGALYGQSAIVKILNLVLLILLTGVFTAPLGYAFSILRGALGAKTAELPEWKGWDVLFKEGAMVLGVGLAYGIVIYILALIVGILMTQIPILGSLFSLLRIVIGILALLGGPFVAIAVCKMAETGKIASSFKVIEILTELKTKAVEYISISLVLLGIMEIVKISLGMDLYGYMISWRGPLNFPMVYLLTPFVMFWILIVSVRMYGQAYSKK